MESGVSSSLTYLNDEYKFTMTSENVGKIDSNGDNCIIKAELRKFINKLNDATGLDFRLPTEEEWKFAANGGVSSNNYTYSGSNIIDDVAWYSGNSNGIQNIASKQPNELGFYDESPSITAKYIEEMLRLNL